MSSKPQKIGTTDVTKDIINSKEYCNTSTHDYCTYITEIVQNKINKNEELSEMLLNRYFSKVCNSIECWSYNYKTLYDLTNNIITKLPVSEIILRKILSLQNSEIFVIYINSLKNIDDNNISNLFKLIGTIPYSETRNNMYDTLINYCINSKNQNIIYLCFKIMIDTYQNSEDIEKILDLKIKPTEEEFYKLLIIFSAENTYEEIIKKCILNGIEIKKDTLKKYIDLIVIEDVRAFYGINNISDICIFLYKNGSTDITINEILKIDRYCEKFINYVIDDDYKITKEEFKSLCEYKIFVKDTKKINQFLDEEEIKTIIFNNNLNYKININYNINILRSECLKRNNYKKISEILPSVKPDIVCLENACSIPSNSNVIKLIHNVYKIPFSEKCILTFAQKNYYNTMMNYVIDSYRTNNNIVMNNDKKYNYDVDNISDD